MDTWGSILLVVNILLLLAGWLLFQQAKSDLTARAAQIPVLSEVKALQRSIAALLEQLKLESNQTSAQLEARCIEARDLLSALDRRLEDTPGVREPRDPREPRPEPKETREPREPKTARVSARRRETVAIPPTSSPSPPVPEVSDTPAMAVPTRYEQVYALSDAGLPPSEVAQRTQYSEGEIELILGLRSQTRPDT